MADTTIPAAVAHDLRDLYLLAPPAGLNLSNDSVRIEHATTEPPSPRLVFIAGEPKAQSKMDGTAFVPISVQFISSMDRMTVEQHETAAAKIDAWWRSIRGAKRRDTLSSRVYLHELITMQPTTAIRKEEREQVTIIRGNLMVTLLAPGI